MNRYNVKIIHEPVPINKQTLDRLSNPLGRHLFPKLPGKISNILMKEKDLTSHSQKKKQPVKNNVNPVQPQVKKSSRGIFLTEANYKTKRPIIGSNRSNFPSESILVAPGEDMGIDMLKQYGDDILKQKIRSKRLSNLPAKSKLSQDLPPVSAARRRMNELQKSSKAYRQETKSASAAITTSSKPRLTHKNPASQSKLGLPNRNKTAPVLTRRERLDAIRFDKETRVAKLTAPPQPSSTYGGSESSLPSSNLSPAKAIGSSKDVTTAKTRNHNGWMLTQPEEDEENIAECENKRDSHGSDVEAAAANSIRLSPSKMQSVGKRTDKSWSSTVQKLRGGNKRRESDILLEYVGKSTKPPKSPKKILLETLLKENRASDGLIPSHYGLPSEASHFDPTLDSTEMDPLRKGSPRKISWAMMNGGKDKTEGGGGKRSGLGEDEDERDGAVRTGEELSSKSVLGSSPPTPKLNTRAVTSPPPSSPTVHPNSILTASHESATKTYGIAVSQAEGKRARAVEVLSATSVRASNIKPPPSQPSAATQLAAHSKRIAGQLAAAQYYAEQYKRLAADGILVTDQTPCATTSSPPNGIALNSTTPSLNEV